jgi:REP-associated tyrosine transposase
MTRTARLVVPGYPHHVTQRGSRGQRTFFSENDCRRYLELLTHYRHQFDVEIWAYCLMPNHVHLVIVPEREDGLARTLQIAHQRYAKLINAREGWQGHLWQERFRSFVMDEPYMWATIRYVEMNPVRAGLCAQPDDWPWSSVHAHLHGCSDPAVDQPTLFDSVPDWRLFLTSDKSGPTVDELRKLTRSGLPGGDENFVRALEQETGRRLVKRKPGPARRKVR